MHIILLRCVQVWQFYRTLSSGLLFSRTQCTIHKNKLNSVALVIAHKNRTLSVSSPCQWENNFFNIIRICITIVISRSTFQKHPCIILSKITGFNTVRMSATFRSNSGVRMFTEWCSDRGENKRHSCSILPTCTSGWGVCRDESRHLDSDETMLGWGTVWKTFVWRSRQNSYNHQQRKVSIVRHYSLNTREILLHIIDFKFWHGMFDEFLSRKCLLEVHRATIFIL